MQQSNFTVELRNAYYYCTYKIEAALYNMLLRVHRCLLTMGCFHHSEVFLGMGQSICKKFSRIPNLCIPPDHAFQIHALQIYAFQKGLYRAYGRVFALNPIYYVLLQQSRHIQYNAPLGYTELYTVVAANFLARSSYIDLISQFRVFPGKTVFRTVHKGPL